MTSETLLDGKVTLHCGDSRDVIKTLEDCSIDSIVTDPPYALVSISKRFGKDNSAPAKVGKTGAYARASRGFMGATWDNGETAFASEFWSEALRVLKPGGHLVAFSGTRTYHRMACAIEDAGFEIRDMLSWMYSTGFPKSHNVSKGIDNTLFRRWLDADHQRRAAYDSEMHAAESIKSAIRRATVVAEVEAKWRTFAGCARDKVRIPATERIGSTNTMSGDINGDSRPWIELAKERGYHELDGDEPATNEARAAKGWGTAFKPALEPICFGRKPIEGTVAENFMAHGTGAINIDACRVGSAGGTKGCDYGPSNGIFGDLNGKFGKPVEGLGRWPANVIHDGSEEVVGMFPDSGTGSGPREIHAKASMGYGGSKVDFNTMSHGDSGSAARFFFQAKQDQRCQLCDANIAPLNSLTESTLTENIVPQNAADTQQRASDGKKPQARSNANNAESCLPECHQPSEDFAHLNADDWLAQKIAQNVKSAADLCDSCAIGIAQSLVATQRGQNLASLQFPGFISGRNVQILRQCLALYVDGRESTDTILTTANLKQLLGSVFHAIAERTLTSGEHQPPGASERLPRFWYESKATADERLGSKHPTVKPTDLMQWLVRSVTPKGGTVLDLFAGTGTTGEAAWREGMRAVLIEREPEYQNDIRRRMSLVLGGPEERHRVAMKPREKSVEELPLFGGSK